MSWTCELTGKAKLSGNKVSHSNIKTRKFSYPNLSKRKWFIEELSRSVSIRLSSAGLKVINARGGLVRAILLEKDANLSDRLIRIKKDLVAKQKLPIAKKKVVAPTPAPEAAV